MNEPPTLPKYLQDKIDAGEITMGGSASAWHYNPETGETFHCHGDQENMPISDYMGALYRVEELKREQRQERLQRRFWGLLGALLLCIGILIMIWKV